MTAVWILLGISLFLFILLMLRCNLILSYRDDFTATLSVLFLKIFLYPAKKKKVRIKDYSPDALEKRRRKDKRKATKAAAKAKKQPTAGTQKPSAKKGIVENLGLLRELLVSLLRYSRGHLRVRTARVRITVATGDAASTAILFGAVNQALVFLLETLDNFGTLRHSHRDEIVVKPDFTAGKTTVDICLIFSFRIWQLLHILFRIAVSYLKSNKQPK